MRLARPVALAAVALCLAVGVASRMRPAPGSVAPPSAAVPDGVPTPEAPPLRGSDRAHPAARLHVETAPATAEAPPTRTTLAFVVRDDSGRPVVGARLLLVGEGRLWNDRADGSDETGRLTGTVLHDVGVAAGPRGVAIVHPSFRVLNLPFATNGATDCPAEEVVLDRGHTLEGSLVAARTEIRGAELVARRLEPGLLRRDTDGLIEVAGGLARVRVALRPDERGRFAVPGLDPGAWVISPECGCLPLTIHPDVWYAARALVRLPGDAVTVDPRHRRIQVTVTSNGAPVPGASVTMNGRTGSVRCLTGGAGDVPGNVVVPPTAFTLDVAAHGFASTQASVADGTDDVTVSIELSKVAARGGVPALELPFGNLRSVRIVGGRGLPQRVPLRLIDPAGRDTPIRVGWFNTDATVLVDDPVPTWTTLCIAIEADVVDGTYVLEAGDGTTGVGRRSWDGSLFAELPPIVLPADDAKDG